MSGAGAGGGNHHHRSGGLRQSNKKNKRTKSSKRSLTKAAGGKVNSNSSSNGNGSKGTGGGANRSLAMAAQSKADRKNMAQQKRVAKRQELLRKRRGVDAVGTSASSSSSSSSSSSVTTKPPRVVGIISLGESADIEQRLASLILHGADRVERPHGRSNKIGNDDVGEEQQVEQVAPTVTAKFNAHKKDGNLTILTCQSFCSNTNKNKESSNNKNDNQDYADVVLSALDLTRVCDVVLLVIDGNGPSDAEEQKILNMKIGGEQDDPSTATGKTGSTTDVGEKWNHLISERGDCILTAIKGQGLPTLITVLAHTEKSLLDDMDNMDHMTMQSVKSVRRSHVKRRLGLKKYVSRFATTEFGNQNDKVVEVDMTVLDESSGDDDGDDNDVEEEAMMDQATTATAVVAADDRDAKKRAAAAALVRTLCCTSCSSSKWVAESPRSFLLSDHYQYDANTKELHVSGHLRGNAPFDIHSLVHLPNIGTFKCKSIQKAWSPLTMAHQKKGRGGGGDDMAVATTSIDNNILEADPEAQESLDMFATADALEGEQNLVGFDEDDELHDDDKSTDAAGAARPAGWSDYQSAWLDAVDEDAVDDADQDHGEFAEELNRKPQKSSGVSTVAPDDIMDLDEANDVSSKDRQALSEQRRKEQSEHQDFPDEVEVKEDEEASKRFARYRSLKSFRKSFWDPKENLPETYASIYHFKSFKATQRSVYKEMKEITRAAMDLKESFFGKTPKTESESDTKMDDSSEDDYDPLEGCVPTGSYVTLTMANIPQETFTMISPQSLITAVSLLPHENKLSVLHMGLSQSAKMVQSDGEPIKSKDVLTFRCGWRTWKARPVFSQNNLNCDKNKFERFLPTGGTFFAASIFGPVTYTPCPVMVFRENARGVNELVAAGSMMGSDADRIVVKRIVLTGYPVRVHKRHATVKYMFYNPDDVKWFKPAGLSTKHGLQGNIIESVGEHGTMKCLFNAPIKQHDTVCLPLYKRIYPKFAPIEGTNSSSNQSTRTATKNHLVVR